MKVVQKYLKYITNDTHALKTAEKNDIVKKQKMII